MLLAVLAAAAGLAGQPAAAPRVAVSEPTAEAARQLEARMIYLGCQVNLTSLIDCRVVNPGPVDPAAAATALKLARDMTVSQDIANRSGGHIVVKLDVGQ